MARRGVWDSQLLLLQPPAAATSWLGCRASRPAVGGVQSLYCNGRKAEYAICRIPRRPPRLAAAPFCLSDDDDGEANNAFDDDDGDDEYSDGQGDHYCYVESNVVKDVSVGYLSNRNCYLREWMLQWLQIDPIMGPYHLKTLLPQSYIKGPAQACSPNRVDVATVTDRSNDGPILTDVATTKLHQRGSTSMLDTNDSGMGAIEMSVQRAGPQEGTFVPKVGQVFESFGDAYQLYNLYSWEMGFSISTGNVSIKANYVVKDGKKVSKNEGAQMSAGGYLLLGKVKRWHLRLKFQ